MNSYLGMELCAQTYVVVVNHDGKRLPNLKMNRNVKMPDGDVYITVPYKTVYHNFKPILEAQSGGVEATRQAELKTDEQEELTTFDDQDQVSYDRDQLVSMLTTKMRIDPYEDQKLQTVLKRNYQIGSWVWTGNDAIGAYVGEINLPSDLVAPHYLGEVMSRFKYMRGTISVKFRLNTTPFHFGQIMASWLPCYDKSYADMTWVRRFQSVNQASNNPHIILAANSRAVVEIKIPFINPRLAVSPTDTDPTIANIKLIVLAPLRTIDNSTVPTVEVTAFANFEDIEVYGLIAQSGETAEAKKKSNDRDVTSVRDVVKYFLPKFAATPIYGGLKTIAAVTHLASDTFKSIGLSKTTDREERQRVVLSGGNALTSGTGIDVCSKITLDADNQIIKHPLMFGTTTDYDEIRNLVRIPHLHTSFDMDMHADPGDILYRIPVQPKCQNVGQVPTDHWSHIGTLANMHHYWRGGMKYSFRFITSSFITGRVRLVWIPNPAPLSIQNNEGDVVSKIVDVVGDTTVNFTIPYLHKRPWLSSDVQLALTEEDGYDKYVNGQVLLYLVNPFVSSQASLIPSVTLVVYVSGAEDLCFAIPHANVNPTAVVHGRDLGEPEPQLIAQSGDLNPRVSFSSTFDPLIPAYCMFANDLVMGETTCRVTELLYRYRRSSATTIPSSSSVYLASLANMADPIGAVGLSDIRDAVNLISMFLGVRGSMRVKMIPASSVGMGNWSTLIFTLAGIGLSNTASDGQVIEPVFTTFPSVELPYLSTDFFIGDTVSTQDDPKYLTAVSPLSNSTYNIYFAAGEDFSIGFPIAPVQRVQP